MINIRINIKTFFLILLMLQAVKFTYSQDKSILDKKISLNIENKTLTEAIEIVSQKSNIYFSYNNQQIPEKTISFQADDKTIRYILNDLLKDTEVGFLVVENHIILKKKNQKKIKHTISGYLKNNRSGEALIGATIFVLDLNKGTISNSYGFYSLTLPEGNYNIVYSYVGFSPVRKKISLSGDKRITIEMKTKTAELEEVIIKSDQDIDFLEQNQMSNISVKPETFDKMPEYLGENDVLKSLQTLPGIKFYGDGSNSFYVRGGYRDQNLILIDEAPIYNPTHFLGFYSSFMPSAINHIKIYKGDIPANYGGRLSSIIDIKTKEGNLKKYQANLSTGLYISKLSVEGPIFKNKSSFFISGRRSNIEWLINDVSDDQELYFYDLNTKLNFKIGQKHRIYLSAYSGKDLLFPENGNTGFSWVNGSATLRWNYIVNDKLFTNTTFYTSKYDYNFVYDQSNNQYWKSYIANSSVKTDITYYYNLNNTYKLGFSYKYHIFNPGNLYLNEQFSFFEIPEISTRHANGTALYLSNERKLGENFSMRLGLRLPMWQNRGPSTEYLFDENYNATDTLTYEKGETYNTFNPFSYLGPRISAKYKLNHKSSIKASYSRIHQYIQLLSNTISPFTNLEVWYPSGPNIPPQRADHYALGYFRNFPGQQINVSIEGFYKKMTNQIAYKEHAKMLLNTLVESELRLGEAYAYGMELLIKKNIGDLEGWLAYTLSKTEKITPELNNGDKYPALYDRPHAFSLFLTYKFNKNWRFSSNWIYTSGAATQTPTSFYYYMGKMVPYYAEKNNDRLPDYKRLDISIIYNLNPSGKLFRHQLSFSLFNALGNENPVYLNFNKIESSEGLPAVPSDYYEIPDYISTELILFNRIPSLTYTLKIL